MKTKIGWGIFLTLILLFGTYSCSTDQPTPTPYLQALFQNIIQINDLNKSMTVRMLGSSVNHFGIDIDIVVENKTDFQISVSANIGEKVFVIRNGQWVQIRNQIQYVGDLILAPTNSGGIEYERSHTVSPVLNPNMTFNVPEPEILRIFIQGVIKNGSQPDHSVGAYVDTLIEP